MSNDLGMDRSGNGNDWTVTNLAYSDQVVDSPTNNFCTMNPISGIGTFSEGNLKVVTAVAGSAPYKQMHYGTISASSGKYYWEVVPTDVTGILLLGTSSSQPANKNQHNQAGSPGTNVYNESGDVDTGETDRTDGASYGVGDIIGVALDMDNDRIYFAKANTWANSGNPSTGSNSYALSNSDDNEQAPIISNDHTSSNVGAVFNFGQDSSFAGTKTAQGNQDGNGIGDFYYTPPTGFLALCTSNLPAVAVVPSENFNTVLYTGNSSVRTIDVGFQPDFVFGKGRSFADHNHWTDSVRGAMLWFKSNSDGAESDYTATDGGVRSFVSNGFTLAEDASQIFNHTGNTYAAWNWKAGNATLGTGDFTQGTIASTCSRSVDAGFSIVSYTGTGSNATVGHGLSKSPEMIIVKARTEPTGGVHFGSDQGNWVVYHSGVAADPETDYLLLNSTDAAGDSAVAWNDTAPTSSVFSISTVVDLNESADTYIAYCFHSVDGYSKVGSYSGNASTDGTFVYTGFQPAFVIIKPSSRTGHWFMANNKSNPYNVVDKVILANDTAAEYTDPSADCKKDFLSNGFKLRTADDNTNDTGETYIYIAFAETPFKYANAR